MSLQLHFVDLRPIPSTAGPLTTSQLSLLISFIMESEKLDGRQVCVRSVKAACVTPDIPCFSYQLLDIELVRMPLVKCL
jgi:hypothetical protein